MISRFKKTGKDISLKRVNEFLTDNFWRKLGVTGVIYDDLPVNPFNKPDRKYSVVEYKEY